jgi:phenylacetate-CoA ligase
VTRAPHWPGVASRASAALRAVANRTPRSRSELESLRDRLLRRLIAHAAESVPFYRSLMKEHGVRACDIRGAADLCALPITSKRDIQRAGPHDGLAVGIDPSRLIERRTTGSTGQPLCIRRTWLEERTLGAYRWRALHALGASPSDRFVEIEEPLPEDSSDGTGLHGALQKLGRYRQLRIDALQAPEAILEEIAGFEPHVIAGYAGVVARVARAATAARAYSARPRVVVVHSDTLTPQMRAAIEAGFGAPVYQIYDCNVVAWECVETGGLHTGDDTAIVEVLTPEGRPAAPGETGEVLLTALHSFAMPFIRYRIGDVVVQGDDPCACGSPFGSIRAVQGRMFDYFPLADGRTIHPYELVNILGETAGWIAEYRLLQARKDLVELRFVADELPTGEQLGILREALRRCLGPQVELRMEQSEGFESEAGAKLRVCRSLVASEYAADAPSELQT